MSRNAILFVKHLFSIIHAYAWTRVIIVLTLPGVRDAGTVRLVLLALVMAGASALLVLAAMRKFVGNGINAHTYSMNHDGFFGLQFNSLIYSLLAVLANCLVLWKFTLSGVSSMVYSWSLFYWNGWALDLPVFAVFLVILVFHRKFDLSKRILEDRSVVFDKWW